MSFTAGKHRALGAPAMAARLAHTLEGLRDPAVRLSWTCDSLQRLGAAAACDVLTVILERAQQGDGPHADLLLMASVALVADAQSELREAVVALAEIRRQYTVFELFRANTGAPSEDPRAGSVPSAGDKQPLTLGERKNLARRRDRDLLHRALRDPHPQVTRVLLDNPALTEEDVLSLCARRPVTPDVLRQVFQHPRWIIRYRVRLALALNPHTPELLALQLVPHLTEGDRRRVAADPQLPQRLRDGCRGRPPDAALH